MLRMHLLHYLVLLPPLLRTALAYSTLSDSSLNSLPFPGDDFDIHTGSILSPILQPRVPNTSGSDAVLDHLHTFFAKNLPEWTLTFQNSSTITPVSDGKPVLFRNLIATRDPPWIQNEGEVGRLALVAHYDSKLTPEGFIGATDSAAPCAMIMHAARSIDAALTKKWVAREKERTSGKDDFSDLEVEDDNNDNKGIQILLLDGEEAFAFWSDTDSLYGARALAEDWESTFHAAGSIYANPLASIDLFVLLDLLGAANPRVPSYFKTTHWAYQHLATLEKRLRQLKLLRTPSSTRNLNPFLPESIKSSADPWLGGLIGDDHVPFMARGVQVLHLIPHPFPSVWHRIEDDGEHLDAATVEDWAVLTAAFAAEWMGLEGFLTGEREGRGMERDEL